MIPEQSTLIDIHCPKVAIRDALVSEGIGQPGENFLFLTFLGHQVFKMNNL